VVSYGCEAWTLTKEERRKLRSFETKSYRRALQRSTQFFFWTSNTILCILADCEPMLEAQCRCRKLAYFEHVVRHDSMEKDIMLGLMCTGNRCKGGQRRQWINDITQWLYLPSSRNRSPSKMPFTWLRIVTCSGVLFIKARTLLYQRLRANQFCLKSSRHMFDQYYAKQQRGHGDFPIYIERTRQRGHGLGNIIGSLWRRILLILKSFAPIALRTGESIFGDVNSGKTLKVSALKNVFRSL